MKADLVAAELARVAAEKQIVLESEDDFRPGTCDSGCAVYLSRNHYCETGISYMLKRLMATPKLIRPVDAEKPLNGCRTSCILPLRKIRSGRWCRRFKVNSW
ncbi:MAG: hypothetical protein R2860_14350 [Desulfobacterales bacterium]